MSKHWSELFYDKAKREGFKFAARVHRPNYCTGFESDEDLKMFNSEEKLYTFAFAKRWSSDPNFDRWELTPYTPAGEHLLSAHLKDGSHWVVAYFIRLDTYTGTL